MKRNTVYAILGTITVSLFTMSLLVSAQPQAGNAGRPQMGQQQRPGEMGRQGMKPGMNRGEMGRQGMQPGPDRGQQGMLMNWQELAGTLGRWGRTNHRYSEPSAMVGIQSQGSIPEYCGRS